MKNLLKLFVVVALFVCVMPSASAAKSPKAKKNIETEVFITDIDCQSCEAKIMKVLPYQKGIKDVKTDLAKRSVTVKYDSSKSSKEIIIASLKKLDVKIVDGKAPQTTSHQHKH